MSCRIPRRKSQLWPSCVPRQAPRGTALSHSFGALAKFQSWNLCSHAPAFPAVGHGSCAVLGLPRPPSLPGALSVFWSWLWRALVCWDLGWGQEGPLFFLTQSQHPHRQLGCGSGMEGELGCLFLCFWARSMNSCAELPALHPTGVGAEVSAEGHLL